MSETTLASSASGHPSWVSRMLAIAEVFQSKPARSRAKANVGSQEKATQQQQQQQQQPRPAGSTSSAEASAAAASAVDFVSQCGRDLGAVRLCVSESATAVYPVLDTCPLPLDAQFWKALRAAEDEYEAEHGSIEPLFPKAVRGFDNALGHDAMTSNEEIGGSSMIQGTTDSGSNVSAGDRGTDTSTMEAQISATNANCDGPKPEKYVEQSLENSAAFNKATEMNSQWKQLFGAKRASTRKRRPPMSMIAPMVVKKVAASHRPNTNSEAPMKKPSIDKVPVEVPKARATLVAGPNSQPHAKPVTTSNSAEDDWKRLPPSKRANALDQARRDPKSATASKLRLAEKRAAAEARRAAVRAAQARNRLAADSKGAAESDAKIGGTKTANVSPANIQNSTSKLPNPSKDPYRQSQWERHVRQRSFCYYRPRSPVSGSQIVYWVTGAPRIEDNWALVLAMKLSRLLSLPLVAVAFVPRAAHDTLVSETGRAVVEERASLRSQLFRVSALYHMRQELHKLNIPLVGLVVDDVDMDCAPIIRKWTAAHKTHVVITDETYAPSTMLAFMRSCAGEQPLGPAQCALYSVDSNCLVPVRYASVGLTASEKAQLADEPAKADAAIQHRGRIGPRMYQALLMRAFKEITTKKSVQWPYARRLGPFFHNNEQHEAVSLQPLSRPLQEAIYAQPLNPNTVARGSDLLILNLAPEFKEAPQCAWISVGAWCGSVDTDAVEANGIPRCSDGLTLDCAPRRSDGSESAALSALLLYTKGFRLPRKASDEARLAIQGKGKPHYLNASLPDEFEGRGVALLLPFINAGSLASLNALQTLQRLGQSVPVAARKRSWALLATREYSVYCAFMHFMESIGSVRRFIVRLQDQATSMSAGTALAPLTFRDATSASLAEHLIRGGAWEWDTFVPEWVRKDLSRHEQDERQQLHFADELTEAKTEDSLWNVIQLRLIRRGELHPSLLGYWARRFLHWVQHPSHAFRFAMRLIEQHAHGGLSPALAAGVIITAFGKFQQQPQSGAADAPVIGRLLPIKQGMVRDFFNHAPPGSFDRFLQLERSIEARSAADVPDHSQADVPDHSQEL